MVFAYIWVFIIKFQSKKYATLMLRTSSITYTQYPTTSNPGFSHLLANYEIRFVYKLYSFKDFLC